MLAARRSRSSTTTLAAGTTRSTLPRRPLSLPAITMTSSPLFDALHGRDLPQSTSGASEMIFMNCVVRSSRVTGPKIRVPIGSKLVASAAPRRCRRSGSTSRPGGASPWRVRTTTAWYTSPFLTRPRGIASLIGDLDDVADVRVAALRAAEYANAHQAARAAVVGGIQHCLCLDHGRPLRVGPRVDRRALDDLDDPPRLALADRAALDDRDRVAFAAGASPRRAP